MRRLKVVYEITMLILAVASVALIWIDVAKSLKWLVYLVWGIFTTDFIFRVVRSRRKITYIIKHPFDVVAIIPLDSVNILARFGKLLYLHRLKRFLTRYTIYLQWQLTSMKFLKVTIIYLLFVVVTGIIFGFYSSLSVTETLEVLSYAIFKFEYIPGRGKAHIIYGLVLKVVTLVYTGYTVSTVLTYVSKIIDKWKALREDKNS